MNTLFSFLVSISLLLTSFSVQAQPAPQVPAFNKVVWVWLENTSYSDMILQKYVKSIWLNIGAGRFSSFKPTSTTTQGNTISMISGTDFGIMDNELTRLFSPSLMDLLNTSSIPWKVYAEEYPGSCYLGTGLGEYKRYRVPFLSYANVQSDRYECAKVMGYFNLTADSQQGNLSQFSIIIPSIKNSGASSNALTADNALRAVLDPIVTSPELFAQTTIIITTTNMVDPSKPAFAMIFGNHVNTNGTTSAVSVNHYSILRTIEDGFGLPNLGQNDATAAAITDIWKSTP